MQNYLKKFILLDYFLKAKGLRYQSLNLQKIKKNFFLKKLKRLKFTLKSIKRNKVI